MIEKMQTGLLSMCFFLIVFSLNSLGQESGMPDDIFTSQQEKKYQKGDELIEKGMSVIIHSDSLSRKVTKKLKRETDMKHEQANLLMWDGYNIKVKVLDELLNTVVKEADKYTDMPVSPEDMLVKLNESKREAGKLFVRSGNTSNLKHVLKYQDEAIEKLRRVVSIVEKELPAKKSEMAAKDTGDEIVEVVAESEAVPEKTVAEVQPHEIVKQEEVIATVVPVVEETKEPVKIIEPVAPVVEETVKPVEVLPSTAETSEASTEDVYFAIQIMADKVRVTNDRLDRVYQGDRKINENIGDGWFRYSVGKFNLYSEAVSAMKNEGIKGFVVAYKGNVRFPLAEAKKITGGYR